LTFNPIGKTRALRSFSPRWQPVALGILVMFGSATAAAQATQSMEERLRAQLRITTAQLQQAQNELAVLKAGTPQAKPATSAAAADPDIAALRKELARVESQLSAERHSRSQATENSQQLRTQAQAATEKASAQVAQYRNAYDELLKMARASEAERQRLAADSALQRTAVTQCEAKNAQLYAVGQEILRAYETLDVGSVLVSRQPFAAQSRVKYEQIAQQYGDKLYEGRFDVRSVEAAAAAAAAAKANPAPAPGAAAPAK
jgi:chromosome segregation ATPase